MAAPIVNVTLPGRLGNPALELRSDPRSDPRVVAAFAPFGLDVTAPSLPIDRNSPVSELLAVAAAAEQNFATVFAALLADVPAPNGVETTIETITGTDGNDITLYVDRPVGAEGSLPGLLHLHGGGMAILQAANESAAGWRGLLAERGCVVVGVEFRNSAGVLGPHPFPAGLNDCSSALDWLHDHRNDLGLASIVVTGESGGGNLSLATALKAKREGRLDRIDGVYAQVPFIYGRYDSCTTRRGSTQEIRWPGPTTPSRPISRACRRT
jgi:acetyl esterase